MRAADEARPNGEFTEERLSAILAQDTVTTVARVRRDAADYGRREKLDMSEHAEGFAWNYGSREK